MYFLFRFGYRARKVERLAVRQRQDVEREPLRRLVPDSRQAFKRVD
jgi:hypothetical protein